MDARSGHGAYRISTPWTASSQDKSHPMSSVPDGDAVALSVRCARRASPVSVVAEDGEAERPGLQPGPVSDYVHSSSPARPNLLGPHERPPAEGRFFSPGGSRFVYMELRIVGTGAPMCSKARRWRRVGTASLSIGKTRR